MTEKLSLEENELWYKHLSLTQRVELLEQAMIKYNQKWTLESLIYKTCEECSELIQDLMKMLLTGQITHNTIEELIDVELMIHQLITNTFIMQTLNYQNEKENKMIKFLQKRNLELVVKKPCLEIIEKSEVSEK